MQCFVVAPKHGIQQGKNNEMNYENMNSVTWCHDMASVPQGSHLDYESFNDTWFEGMVTLCEERLPLQATEDNSKSILHPQCIQWLDSF